MKSVEFQNFHFYIIWSIYINDKYAIFRNSYPNYEKKPAEFQWKPYFFS